MDIKKFYKNYTVFSTLIIMLLISVLIVLIVSGLTKFISLHGQEYELPDFTGMDAEQIKMFENEENIYNYRLVINDSVFVPDKKGGIVLSQDPAAGSKVKKGRKVYLSIVALSMPSVEMPNLVDLSLRQAENMLQSNDLQLGQIIYKASKYPNAVLEQRYKGRIIEAGTFIPYQSKITLIVGQESFFGEEIDDEF
jgi:beta-lactam-binding protein with PASTA domain